jgi:hypothetical protein
MNIKTELLTCSGIVRYIKHFFQHKHKVTFRKCIWALSKGFLPESIVHYSDFKRYPRNEYINDWQTYTKAIRINSGYNEIMNNKLMFYDMMHPTGKTPQVYGYIAKNGIVLFDKKNPDMDELIALLKDKKSLFFKRFEGGSGEGIFKAEYRDGEFWINRDKYCAIKLKEHLKAYSGVLIMECLYNSADYAVKIFPKTLNTVKILTMINPKNNKAFIAGAFQRFGTESSYPLDNMSTGGVSCLVNLETGRLETSYVYDPITDSEQPVENHPNTDEKILGITLPNWEKIKGEILEIANRYSYLKYVAWDIALTKDSFIIIEGNANSETWGFQLGMPLLRNPKVKDFYLYYGVLK